jgi:hypothetical protein
MVAILDGWGQPIDYSCQFGLSWKSSFQEKYFFNDYLLKSQPSIQKWLPLPTIKISLNGEK